MKRVAVTGLGVISPVGNDVPTFWNALCSGTCGIGPITKFDATDYPVKLAAEVRDFDPKQYMEKLDILHSDVYTHFAMAAACQAVADSGIAGTLDAERVGVYIGSGIGGIATFMTEHSKLLSRGPRRVSPYFIPMMIPNMASSMIAMRYHFHGPAMPMVTACASGTNAIGEALRLIRITQQSFFEGIKYAREGHRLSDISAAVQAYVEANGCTVVREYVGHGIGRHMHEPPEVPNYGKPGHGPRLLRGMTIAVEPMVNAGSAAIVQMSDGWTVKTADGKNAAHYENTVLITDGEPELLTDPSESLV